MERLKFLLLALLAVALGACQPQPAGQSDGVADSAAETAAETPVETPEEFVARVNAEWDEVGPELGAAYWVRATYITPDTAILAAKASERSLNMTNRIIEESKQFVGQEMSDDAARQINLFKIQTSMPGPSDPEKVAELARIRTDLGGMYGAGKWCPEGKDDDESCQDLEELSEVIDKSRDYDELLDAWIKWRTVSPPMRDMYERFVELMNEGAAELGFDNTGELWKAGYDMPGEEFEAEVERLWSQVNPLYNELHCYVGAKLRAHYGENLVPAGQPIPAHLLGNMWAQQWANIYDLVEPYPGVAQFSITDTLEELGWSEEDMVKSAESFYTSLGMPALPDSFWTNSLFTKPRDRDVVCHASAWPLGDRGVDVRIKQCIVPTQEELLTIYHELGHVYYFMAYPDLDNTYRAGAHDGFHEAIGDTINLAMTPGYFKEVGLLDTVEVSEEATLNNQMMMALDKIAFLPFGKLMDQWRWKVFSGEISPDEYNQGWWDLRTEYQGIRPPVERTEADFDPGAKYHIPGNTPYTRYFLSFIIQFQFYQALCDAAGHEGPLHECSFYGNKEAGDRFWAMMQKGASQPWQDTLYELTGTREMDGSAIINYFEPLMGYLKEQNDGQMCGWSGG